MWLYIHIFTAGRDKETCAHSLDSVRHKESRILIQIIVLTLSYIFANVEGTSYHKVIADLSRQILQNSQNVSTVKG